MPAQRKRTVPNWFWITVLIWLFAWVPAVVVFSRSIQLNWFIAFLAIIFPLWAAVRVWVHRVSRARNR